MIGYGPYLPQDPTPYANFSGTLVNIWSHLSFFLPPPQTPVAKHLIGRRVRQKNDCVG
jgi:hypothetical protein